MDPLERVYRLDVSSNGNRIGLLSSSGILSVTALELQARKSGISILYGKDDNPFTGNSRGLRLSGDHGWTAALFSPFSDMSSPVYLSLGGKERCLGMEGVLVVPSSFDVARRFVHRRTAVIVERTGWRGMFVVLFGNDRTQLHTDSARISVEQICGDGTFAAPRAVVPHLHDRRREMACHWRSRTTGGRNRVATASSVWKTMGTAPFVRR